MATLAGGFSTVIWLLQLMTLRSMSFRHTVRLYWRPSGSTSRTDESCSGTGC